MPEGRTVVTVATRRVFWSVLLGSLLVQLAWIVALPTFRGPDEFDHVYKADAVAAGQLSGAAPARRGRGDLLDVRRGVVEAAGPLCSSYAYTGPENCRPVRDAEDGRVVVASAAASYNPAYYLAVGSAARWLDGHAFDLGLRVITSTGVALLLAVAAATAASRARTLWPLAAVGVAYTPTVALSGATAAPNGVGYAAAALWWVSALAVVDDDERPPWGRLGLASVLLVSAHTMNVVWLPLMTAAVLALRPRAFWLQCLRRPRPALTVAVVLAAGLASVAWIRLAGTNRLNDPIPGIGPLPLGRLASSELVWALQTVATGPSRDDAAPIVVYVLWSLALLALGAVAWRAADRRSRGVAVLLLAAWVAVPVVLTIVSYPTEGLAWQGRYAIPLVVGLTFLAGRVMDRGRPVPAPAAVAIASVVGLTHVWCVLAVLLHESSPRHTVALVQQLPLAATALAVGATAALGVALLVGVTTRTAQQGTTTPDTASSSA